MCRALTRQLHVVAELGADGELRAELGRPLQGPAAHRLVAVEPDDRHDWREGGNNSVIKTESPPLAEINK